MGLPLSNGNVGTEKMARRLAQVAEASTIPPVLTGERFGTKRRRFGTIKITPGSYSISSLNGGKYNENRIEIRRGGDGNDERNGDCRAV
ncbi:hypothetical protein [Klebsiella oxytoca]|uniref:Uncharacterized protein n=1 Tax=Klebsiella oxytoca TaxID=571 RepID=A0A6B8MRF4_KLEOX|nr:hypothetical protein [Klebsiella oxytoca]QGN37506.1 hypothetical protein GJ746_09355 [Klebsiella oxytoca]